VAGLGAVYATLGACAGLHLPFPGKLGALVVFLGIATTWLRGLACCIAETLGTRQTNFQVLDLGMTSLTVPPMGWHRSCFAQ